MTIPCHYERNNPPSYKEYKAEKFEKTKTKVEQILKGIDQLSLKEEDKKKLIKQIKILVENF
jgi:hypothetical protein